MGGGKEPTKEEGWWTPEILVFGFSQSYLFLSARKRARQTEALFSFPPTSLKLELYGLTSGFTRLIMKTKYACFGLISLHANFHDNRTKGTATSNIKICRWGGGSKKSPNRLLKLIISVLFKTSPAFDFQGTFLQSRTLWIHTIWTYYFLIHTVWT